MIKLEGGLGYFIINGESYPVGQYRLIYRSINVGIEDRDGLSIVHPTSFMEWRNEFDGIYGTREDLLDDLRSKIFSRV